MTTESDKPKPSGAKPDEAPPAKADAAKPAAKKPDGKLPPFDERRLTFAEIAPFAAQLDAAELATMANDGRAVVRANAALGLAALNQPVFELVAMLRDSDPHAAAAAAEAVGRLGVGARALIPQIVQALGSTHTDVTGTVNTSLAELIGKADDELILALDVPYALAMKSIVEAARKIGKAGIRFLIKAAGHERIQIRVNAIGGLARLGKTDIETSMAFLTTVEANDPVPDVRTAAKQAMLAVIAREKVEAIDNLPKNIPDFEARKLSGSELREYADAIHIDEMLVALQDGRAHVKINAARALGIKGDKAARAANALGVNLRDSVPAVRKEMAVALGKLGEGALDAVQDLVGALGDVDEEVSDAAIEAVAGLGESAREALVRGLDAGSEPHGLRVGELIGRLPRGATTLTEAFKSPAVNVQVNAVLGLGLLRDKVGSTGLAALHGARTGGDARTREAVRRALDMIEPRGPTGPKAITIDGFEDRFLDGKDVEKAKAEVEKIGVADLTAYLMDGRDVVRANAATALAALGPAGASAAGSLGVRLRDDAARVRLAAAQALDKLGDAVVVETANDLVGALRDADDKVAETTAAVLRARKGKMIGALVRGLETDDPRHARRICEVINAIPDAAEILAEAFDSPAVNVQVNAALGLGMLGAERVGKGRKKLEGARTGGDARTREAARKALDSIDGPREIGPRPVDVAGFETQLLGAEAFT
ncbi:MAG: HEAT repeat domain-containing protein, partial [Deltaproteobacteria bacterium]|nr:HEAT repeat domain-containing protein [Deltaproteobacteria bacterium]